MVKQFREQRLILGPRVRLSRHRLHIRVYLVENLVQLILERVFVVPRVISYDIVETEQFEILRQSALFVLGGLLTLGVR